MPFLKKDNDTSVAPMQTLESFPPVSKKWASALYELLLKIPAGRVATYGQMSRLLGLGSSRFIGQLLKRNPNPIVVPCHRVVKSDGSLGGYSYDCGAAKKIELLEQEGVVITNGRIDLKLFGWSYSQIIEPL